MKIVFALQTGIGISPLLTSGHSHASDLTGCHKAFLLQNDFNIHSILLGTPFGFAEYCREIDAPRTVDVQNYLRNSKGELCHIMCDL
jgi:hypothetical protein